MRHVCHKEGTIARSDYVIGVPDRGAGGTLKATHSGHIGGSAACSAQRNAPHAVGGKVCNKEQCAIGIHCSTQGGAKARGSARPISASTHAAPRHQRAATARKVQRHHARAGKVRHKQQLLSSVKGEACGH